MFEIFQYDFMIRAFIAGVVIALIAPLIGNFLVARRYSLLADTLAHVSLVGVAIGVLTHNEPVFVSLICTIIAALLIERLRMARQISGESVLALFLSGSLALASVLLALSKGSSTSLFSYLFGSIATVTQTDVMLILGVGSAVVVTIGLLYKEFFFVALNEELAQASGVRVKVMNMLMILLAAATVALSMRIVGALLIGALMVIPVVAATQLRRGFAFTICCSMVFSLIAMLSGLTISYYADLPSGGTIILVSLGIFLLTTLLRTAQR